MKTDEVIYYEKVVLDDKELPEESGDYLCKWIQDSTQNIIISEMKFNKDDSRSIIFWNEFVFWYLRPTSLKDERFKMPTDKQLCDIMLLFNNGKIQKNKLADMLSPCLFILDRLYENGNVMKKSSKEYLNSKQ